MNNRSCKLKERLWKKIIEKRLRKEITVSKNQLGFMSGRSTMELTFYIKQLIEIYREET